MPLNLPLLKFRNLEKRFYYILPYNELTPSQHVHSNARFVNYAMAEKLPVSANLVLRKTFL